MDIIFYAIRLKECLALNLLYKYSNYEEFILKYLLSSVITIMRNSSNELIGLLWKMHDFLGNNTNVLNRFILYTIVRKVSVIQLFHGIKNP